MVKTNVRTEGDESKACGVPLLHWPSQWVRGLFPANDNCWEWTYQEAEKRARKVRIEGVPFGGVVSCSRNDGLIHVEPCGRRWFLNVARDVSFQEVAEVLRKICERFETEGGALYG
jgi:hypothetical protein